MSSPIKRRTALVGKSTNIKGHAIRKGSLISPSKRSQVNVDYALRCSPVRDISTSQSSLERYAAPVPSLSFSIHEETAEERAAILIDHMSLSQAKWNYHDENDFTSVKENMSPSKMDKTVKSTYIIPPAQICNKRKPLRDLSITEYKGSVEDPKTQESTPLTLHCSMRTKLPNFITPPRDRNLSQYFSHVQPGSNDHHPHLFASKSTDDIPKDKVVRKLNFKICED